MQSYQRFLLPMQPRGLAYKIWYWWIGEGVGISKSVRISYKLISLLFLLFNFCLFAPWQQSSDICDKQCIQTNYITNIRHKNDAFIMKLLVYSLSVFIILLSLFCWIFCYIVWACWWYDEQFNWDACQIEFDLMSMAYVSNNICQCVWTSFKLYL